MPTPSRDAVARFIINQVCDCPYCQRQFSIVSAIRSGAIPPKQMTVSQSVHEKADITTAKKQITVNVPRPSYFGAFCQYTKFEEGNEEYINCISCGGLIRVIECDFDYSIMPGGDKVNAFTRIYRMMFPYRSKKHLDMNKD